MARDEKLIAKVIPNSSSGGHEGVHQISCQTSPIVVETSLKCQPKNEKSRGHQRHYRIHPLGRYFSLEQSGGPTDQRLAASVAKSE